MQRRYNADDYQKLIHKIKKQIPDAGIGVDVIVGFPGETNEDFWITHNFIRDLPISYLHVFTYSERPDTKAIELDSKVNIHGRRERNNILRILSDKKRNEFYNKMIGKELDVLFENENHNGVMKGFSSNYIRVSHSYNNHLVNNIYPVKITRINDGLCLGNVLDTKKAVDLIVS